MELVQQYTYKGATVTMVRSKPNNFGRHFKVILHNSETEWHFINMGWKHQPELTNLQATKIFMKRVKTLNNKIVQIKIK